jgi:hypothetical protein
MDRGSAAALPSAAGLDAPPEDDARKNILLVVFTCTDLYWLVLGRAGMGSFWVDLGGFSKALVPYARSGPWGESAGRP